MLRTTQQYIEVLGELDGQLQATQQYVDVLGELSSKVQVTQQYARVTGGFDAGNVRAPQQCIMVLVPAPAVFDMYVTSELELEQLLEQREPHVRITHDLNLSQKAPARHRLFAINTLDLEQFVRREIDAVVESVLELDYDWLHDRIPNAHFSTRSTLALNHHVDVDAGLFVIALSVLALAGEAVGRGPIKRSFRHRLHLVSRIPFQDHFAKVTTPLGIIQRLGQVFEEDVDSVLALIDEVLYLMPDHLLELIQTVEFEHIKTLLSQLELTHQVDLSAIRDRLSAHTLELGQSLLSWYRDKCITKAYHPLIGEGKAGQPEPPPAQLPPQHSRPTEAAVVLTYPATGEGTYSVSLRAPNLDNKDRQTFTRINRETMGGRLTVFTDPAWPKLHTLLLSFSGLSASKVSEFQDFLLHSLGQLVMLHDWEGRHWVGVVTTPNDQIVADGKHGYTATFEFQGELVESPGTGSGLGLSQHVTVTVE